MKSLGRSKTVRTKVFTIVRCQLILIKIQMDDIGAVFFGLILSRLLLLGFHLDIRQLKPFKHVRWQ